VDARQPSSHEAADVGGKGKDDEKMQGLLKVVKLPVLSERGLSVGAGEDMAFAVGRRRFVIRPFHLPPLEGDGGEESKGRELEF
jgi:elongator complex protein 4